MGIFKIRNNIFAYSSVIPLFSFFCLSGGYILEISQNWTLTSVFEEPNTKPNTFNETYIILPGFFSIQSWLVLLFVDYCQGGVTLLHVGGEGSFSCLRVEGVGDGEVFVRVWFIILFLRLFQVSVRADNFSLRCSKHLIIWLQYLSLLASFIQYSKVPYQGSIFTLCAIQNKIQRLLTGVSVLWYCG